jgi:hypothetical protein
MQLSNGPEPLTLRDPHYGSELTVAAADPSRIEPTTGAPITALPQRAPVRVPRPSSPRGASGDGRVATLRAAVLESPQTDVEPVIWPPIEQVHWDGTPIDPDAEAAAKRYRSARTRRPRSARTLRSPTSGLAGLLLTTLLASFFAWVSAEPLWIAVGHAERGTATVVNCGGSGIALRCRADFRAASGAFTARDVRLTGVAVDHRRVGSEVAAHMIGAGGRTAYADEGAGTLHLRWGLGLTLVLACVAGGVWATGALRLPDGRRRRDAWLAGLAGHLLITAGFLAAAF